MGALNPRSQTIVMDRFVKWFIYGPAIVAETVAIQAPNPVLLCSKTIATGPVVIVT